MYKKTISETKMIEKYILREANCYWKNLKSFTCTVSYALFTKEVKTSGTKYYWVLGILERTHSTRSIKIYRYNREKYLDKPV